MGNVRIEVKLTIDEGSEASKELRFEVEEELPGEMASVDRWEGAVRRLGFETMRRLFTLGIEAVEAQVLSGYRHRDEGCEWIKQGRRGYTLRTVFGKVRLDRQRVYCKTCGAYVVPVNAALGLHEGELGTSTSGFQSLVSLCGIHGSYRLAQQWVGELTQDEEVVSVRQVESIVDAEGDRLRQQEEEAWHEVAYDVIREIQDRKVRAPMRAGKLYVCMDGMLVRSTEGKGRWREGKVGLICTDDREPLGKQGRQQVPVKQYVSSFESSEVFGSWVYAQGIGMGMRDYAEVVVLGDGARWIRQVRKQCFRQSRYILDWYHLREKVWKTMKVVFGDDRVLRRMTKATLTRHLWRGEVHLALEVLEGVQEILGEAKDVSREAVKALAELRTYLWSNREGIIPYGDYQKAGYMISSSLVEKAADVVIAKRQKKHQGMHWCHRGAEGLSGLRTLWLNGQWEAYWKTRQRKVA